MLRKHAKMSNKRSASCETLDRRTLCTDSHLGKDTDLDSHPDSEADPNSESKPGLELRPRLGF